MVQHQSQIGILIIRPDRQFGWRGHGRHNGAPTLFAGTGDNLLPMSNPLLHTLCRKLYVNPLTKQGGNAGYPEFGRLLDGPVKAVSLTQAQPEMKDDR